MHLMSAHHLTAFMTLTEMQSVICFTSLKLPSIDVRLPNKEAKVLSMLWQVTISRHQTILIVRVFEYIHDKEWKCKSYG